MLAATFAPLNRFSPDLLFASRTPTLAPKTPAPQVNRASEASLPDQDARVNRAAGNILNFIDRQLAVDAEAGRSQAQLQSRFDAGAEGFLQGFNDALEELDARGLLSAELEAELSATRDKVLQGLQSLAEEYGLDTDALPASDLPDIELPPAAPASQGSALVFGRNTFSFSVTTREGDEVTISAFSEMGRAGRVSAGGVAYYERQSQGFSFQVQGDLNDDELGALNELLGQVNNLSELFYSGDLDGAFDAALALDFDAGEIAGFALDMRQTLVAKVRTTYGQPNTETSPLRQQFQPMTGMADQIAQALETARTFLQPLTLLGDLLDQSLAGFEHNDRAGKHKLFSDVGQAMAEKLLEA